MENFVYMLEISEKLLLFPFTIRKVSQKQTDKKIISMFHLTTYHSDISQNMISLKYLETTAISPVATIILEHLFHVTQLTYLSFNP